MGQTVKELLYDAIYCDEPFLAHTIYYAVQNGFVQSDTPSASIPYKQLDYLEITKMCNENKLMMCTVKLFTVPMTSNKFALYLAENKDEVRAEHHRNYRSRASAIIDLSDKMDTTIYCEELKRWKNIRALKREVLNFPYFVGEMVGRRSNNRA